MYRKTPKGWLKHWDFILLELISLQVSFFIAYFIRNAQSYTHIYKSELYVEVACIFFLVDICVIYFAETFKDVLKRGVYKELAKTFKHIAIVIVTVVLVLFVMKKEDVSRAIIIMTGGIHFINSFALRMAYKYIYKIASDMTETRSLLIITSSDLAEENIDAIRKKHFGFYRIAGIVFSDDDSRVGQEIEGIKVVSSFEDAPEFVAREWVDEVLLSVDFDQENLIPVYHRLAESGVTTHLSLKEIEKFDNRPHIVENIAGQVVLTGSLHYTTTRQEFIKRAVDIVGGLVGCIITLLLTIVVGPAIKISSPGPVFFRQERIGMNGRRFKIFKFRTMYPDAEARKQALLDQNNIKDGMMFKMDFDPRIIGNRIMPDGSRKTGVGQWLRNHSVDEFPQFFNVLIGQMSLVGTRPPTPDEWDKYKLHHRARLSIKPGITGLWQVSGRSEITDFEEVVKLDTEYITNWSMEMDLKIILKTIWVVLSGSGAK